MTAFLWWLAVGVALLVTHGVYLRTRPLVWDAWGYPVREVSDLFWIAAGVAAAMWLGCGIGLLIGRLTA